jgi:hypothetical protein
MSMDTGNPAKRSLSVFWCWNASTVVGGHLLAVHHRLERRTHGDLGLAVADVAAEQAVHRRGRFHVLLDVGNGSRLIRRQFVRKRALEFLLPVGVG